MTLDSNKNYFEVDDIRDVLIWIYYNPDSDAGGQFVATEIPCKDVLKIITMPDLEEALIQYSRETYLYDIGTALFEVIRSSIENNRYKVVDNPITVDDLLNLLPSKDVLENDKFELGNLIVTRGVFDRVGEDAKISRFVAQSLARYKKGDWGDTCKKDADQNNDAIKNGERILAVYIFDEEKDDRIWIITEWDRSVTTILFPDEY